MFGRKKKNNDEKIIAALDSLDKSIRLLQGFAEKYNQYIDEAALRNDKKTVSNYIRQKLSVLKTIEQFKAVKSKLELGAFSAKALSELGKLPAAISGCKGLLSGAPDFSKLSKDITSIFKEIDKTGAELDKLTNVLDPEPEQSFASRLMGAPEEELSDEFKAEYAAMEERIGAQIAGEQIAAAPRGSASTTDSIDPTGIIDIASEIEKEKNKK